jgi:hypothetical protein
MMKLLHMKARDKQEICLEEVIFVKTRLKSTRAANCALGAIDAPSL